jgi:hypothetical protein
MSSQLVWAAVVLRTVVLDVGRWEHEGTLTTEVAAIAAGTMGDGPTVVAEDDTVVPWWCVYQVVLRWSTPHNNL